MIALTGTGVRQIMSNDLFVAAILTATAFAGPVLAGSSSSTDVKSTHQANAGKVDGTKSAQQQIRLEQRSPSYWRVTLDNPPFNIFGPDTIPQLEAVIKAIETDEQVKVVVFDSAVPGFFLTHYKFVPPLEQSTSLPAGPTRLHPLPDMLIRLSRAPVVSIVSIRGRATGVGSELALASDMRFAS